MPVGDQRSAPTLPEQEAATQRRQAFSGSHKGKIRNASPIDQRSKYGTSEESSTAGFDEQPDEINWFEDVYEVNDTTLAAEGVTGWPLTYEPIPFSEVVTVNGVVLRRGQQFHTFSDVDDSSLYKIGTLNDAFHGYPQGAPWEIRIQYAFQGISSITPDSTPVSSGTQPPWGTDPWDTGGGDPDLIQDWKRILIRFTTAISDSGVIQASDITWPQRITYPGVSIVDDLGWGNAYDCTVRGNRYIEVGAGVEYPAGPGEAQIGVLTADYSRLTFPSFSGLSVGIRVLWFVRYSGGLPGSLQFTDEFDLWTYNSGYYAGDYIASVDYTKNGPGAYRYLIMGPFWYDWIFKNTAVDTVLARGSLNAGEANGGYQPVDWTLSVDSGYDSEVVSGEGTLYAPVHRLRLDVVGSGSIGVTGSASNRYVAVDLIADSGLPIELAVFDGRDSGTYYLPVCYTYSSRLTSEYSDGNRWMAINPIGIGLRAYNDPNTPTDPIRWGPYAFTATDSDSILPDVPTGPFSGSVDDGLSGTVSIVGGVVKAGSAIQVPAFGLPGWTAISRVVSVLLDRDSGDYVSEAVPLSNTYLSSGAAATVTLPTDAAGVTGDAIAACLQSILSSDGGVTPDGYDKRSVALNRQPAMWDFIGLDAFSPVKGGTFDAGAQDSGVFPITYTLYGSPQYADNGELRFEWQDPQGATTSITDPATTIGPIDIMLITVDGVQVSAGSFTPDWIDGPYPANVTLQAKRTADDGGAGWVWYVNPMAIGFRRQGQSALEWGPYAFSPPIQIQMAAGILDADTEVSTTNRVVGLDGLLYYRDLRPIQQIISQADGATAMDTDSTPVSSLMGVNDWEILYVRDGNDPDDDPVLARMTVWQNGVSAIDAQHYQAPDPAFSYVKLKSNRSTSVLSLSGYSTSVTHLDGTISGDSFWVSGGSDPADPGDDANVPPGSGDWDIDTGDGGGGGSW